MIGAALTFIDGLLSVVLPDLVRIGAWATLCGLSSLWLYAAISPQQRLRELRDESATLQKRLSTYEGEFAGATMLIRRNLMVALKRLGLALAPSLLAGLPVIVVIFWMADTYSVTLPKSGEWLAVDATPPDAAITCNPAEAVRNSELDGSRLVRWPSAGEVDGIYDGAGTQVMQLPLKTPRANLRHRDSYGSLMARQVECLPAQTAIKEIHLDMPVREILHFGPPWMRSWLFPFVAVTLCTAVCAKHVLRIS